MRERPRERVVRTLLGLTGVVALATGANVGFGGIATLGLEGSGEFFQVTEPAAFAMHDSHVRYLGGVWFGMGLLFLACAWRLERLRTLALGLLALVFAGGLARISAPDLSVLATPGIAPSFLAEIVLMPVLFWRVWAGGRQKVERPAV